MEQSRATPGPPRRSFWRRSRSTVSAEIPGRRKKVTPRTWFAALLSAALLASLAVVVVEKGPEWRSRYEAWNAVRALKDGDLPSLGERLAGNRGDTDFAYYFTSKVTPRDLGDVLSTVAGASMEQPFKADDFDAHVFDLQLTDLAGVLALATHGTGDRRLRPQWTSDFIAATTTPRELYTEDERSSGEGTTAREKQDEANRANLLHLLARGYWSPEFLKEVTRAYVEFDRKEKSDAWPAADPDNEARYAPSPAGVYLTDGVLALSAALTANPRASEWAFTEFQPDTVELEGADQRIGSFTHYLMFEHKFPDVESESVGMTTALTALSSAIDSANWAKLAEAGTSEEPVTGDAGPMHDVVVLQALARELEESNCSWNPLDYGHCLIEAAKAVFGWAKRWGHLVLDILAVASSFAPPPFNFISLAPASLNATWYGIEGDYVNAGLSLAATVPGLGFRGIAKRAAAAKGIKITTSAAKAASEADDVAKVARTWRPLKPWKDCDLSAASGGIRVKYGSDWTRAQRNAADEKMRAIFEAGSRGGLHKTKPVRSGSATARYVNETGGRVRSNENVDHTIELQLGGKDDVTNMKPLDKTVNSSFGTQIEKQIRDLNYGDPIPTAAIC